jgi:hypothetical protein
MKGFYLLAIFLICASGIAAQQKTDTAKMEMKDCPMMKDTSPSTDSAVDYSKMNHDQMVMQNGEKAMGFSQTETTHHFLIMKDGGAIQVEANDAKDTVNRDKIRVHLAEITEQFQAGVFTTPFAVHGQVPPGVPEMNKLKDTIMYMYEETGKGARVRIMTKNAEALTAIRSFLTFQIQEHKTGDPIEVK